MIGGGGGLGVGGGVGEGGGGGGNNQEKSSKTLDFLRKISKIFHFHTVFC